MSKNNLYNGIEKLYTKEQFAKIRAAKIIVIGLGGVGSWAAEAIVRSGVQHITLIDYDEICSGNTNRQLHTTQSTVGKFKADVLAQRFKDIDPQVQAISRIERYDETTAEGILTPRPTLIIDCTDRLKNKIHLINECIERKIPVVTVGSSGHRTDPTQIRIADLNETTHDRLLFYVRKRLRERHQFPKREIPANVRCVYSAESIVNTPRPKSLARTLDCGAGLGSATYITGTFGFFAAAEAIRMIANTESSR